MEIFVTKETLEDVYCSSFLGTIYLSIEIEDESSSFLRDNSTTGGAFLMFTTV
jgi:hypothetical protein